MRSAIHILLAFAGCLHLVGGHHGVMQVVAWTHMLVDYSAENGLGTGVRMTFDGLHPCERCESIAADKQERQQSPTLPTNPRGESLRAEIKPCPLADGHPALKAPAGESLPFCRYPAPGWLTGLPPQPPEAPPPRQA